MGSLDSSTLLLSLFISTIGFGYLTYGRKRPAYPFIFSGAIMLIYGYFIESFWLSLAIGVVLAVLPFLVR